MSEASLEAKMELLVKKYWIWIFGILGFLSIIVIVWLWLKKRREMAK